MDLLSSNADINVAASDPPNRVVSMIFTYSRFYPTLPAEMPKGWITVRLTLLRAVVEPYSCNRARDVAPFIPIMKILSKVVTLTNRSLMM